MPCFNRNSITNHFWDFTGISMKKKATAAKRVMKSSSDDKKLTKQMKEEPAKMKLGKSMKKGKC